MVRISHLPQGEILNDATWDEPSEAPAGTYHLIDALALGAYDFKDAL